MHHLELENLEKPSITKKALQYEEVIIKRVFYIVGNFYLHTKK